jgi:hypothetical protein
MEGADWLRTQLTHFGCAVCGEAFPAERIRVLAQRDDLYFVDLDCVGCGSGAVAIVTIEIEGDEARVEPGELTDLREAGRERDAVDADDVLAMHAFLERFDGDFQTLFGSSHPPTPPARGA